mgnify:FL=1|tara:strand:+ start:239 stop:445 length:207 start_codon:yes stop_codon:yes gene_type:complete
MTKNITINAPEGTSIEGLQIEQTISQPADLEVGPVKVGDFSVLTWSNISAVIILLGVLAIFYRFTKTK